MMKKKDKGKLLAEAEKVRKSGGGYVHFQVDKYGDAVTTIAGDGLKVMIGLAEIIGRIAEETETSTDTVLELLTKMCYDIDHMDLISAMRGEE